MADKVDAISTHAPRTGSDADAGLDAAALHEISTHAPRTGSDPERAATLKTYGISTHAPRTGSDVCYDEVM